MDGRYGFFVDISRHGICVGYLLQLHRIPYDADVAPSDFQHPGHSYRTAEALEAPQEQLTLFPQLSKEDCVNLESRE